MARERDVSPSRHVYDEVRTRIVDGQIKPGESVGSVAQASTDYDVTYAAAKVAFKSLVDDGWLVTGAAREGHRVADQLPDPDKPRLTLEERVDRIERHLGLDN